MIQLDLLDEECFDDDEGDSDHGLGDVEPLSDVDSEATEAYDVTVADVSQLRMMDIFSSDPDSESGIDDKTSFLVSKSRTCCLCHRRLVCSVSG